MNACVFIVYNVLVFSLHPDLPAGFASGMNLSGLELGSMVGGGGGLKDAAGQQSRFKWMMEGHSPAPSPPDSALKNGKGQSSLAWYTKGCIKAAKPMVKCACF